MRLPEPRALIEDVLRVWVKRRECADGAQEDAHRVSVVAEPLHEFLHVLVKHRVERDFADPRLLLRGRRQLAEQKQVRRLEIVAPFGELLDGVASILQDALVPVDERDGAPAVGRVHEGRVVRHEAEVLGRGLHLPEVHRANRAVFDRQLVLLARAVVENRKRIGHRI